MSSDEEGAWDMDGGYEAMEESHRNSLKITKEIMSEIKKSKTNESATLKKMKLEDFKKLEMEQKAMEEEEKEKEQLKVRHTTLKGSLKKEDLSDPVDEPHASEEEMDEGEQIHLNILRQLAEITEKKVKKKQEKLEESEKKVESAEGDEADELRKENERLKKELEKSKKKKVKVEKKENFRRKKFKKADVLKIIEEKQMVYLNINSFSRRGEHLYNVLRETLPLPVDKKFSLIGQLKKQKKKYFFVIYKKLMHQYWYYSTELDEIVKVNKKKQGKRIKKEFRAYYLPNIKFIKKTISLIPKKGYVAINNLYENGTLK